MPRNEKTGPKVRAIAGRVLRALKSNKISLFDHVVLRYDPKDAADLDDRGFVTYGADPVCSADDLKALAASCLTQSPDRPAKPKGKK